MGKTITTQNDLRLTLKEFVLTNRIGRGENVKHPPEGKRFLVARIHVRNNGTESAEPPGRSDFFVQNAEDIRYGALELGYGSGSYSQPITGATYQAPYSLGAGKTMSGLIAFKVPADIQQPRLSAPNLSAKETDAVDWKLSTAAKHQIIFETQVEVPKGDVIQHRKYTYPVTVTNKGGRTGKFKGKLAVSGGKILSKPATIATAIDGGESVTREITVRVTGDETYSVFFGDKNLVKAKIKPPTYAFGETWSTPGGLKVTVKNVQFTSSIQYTQNDETKQATPDSGRQFLIFEVVSRYTGTESNVAFPARDDFTIELPSGTIEDHYTLPYDSELDGGTVDGWYAPSTLYSYGPGDEERGWLIYSVDQSLTLSDVTIHALRSTGLGGSFDFAQWTKSGER